MLPAASYFGKMLRLAARGLAGRGDMGRLPKERLVAERSGIQSSPRQLARYLKVTEGAGIARFSGEDALLPPTYPALWETALGLELLYRPQMPPVRGGVIHLGSECLPLRPLRLGDRVRCRLELERAEPDPRGLRLQLLSRNWNAPGQLCAENRMLLLLRGAQSSTGRAARPGAPAAPEEVPQPAGWEEVARWSLRGSHGRRYARASGDYNPVHLWSLTARPFGYRRPILHGFCTQALVAHALIARLWEGDPTRLRRLRITFRAPLLLPARVALQITDPSQHPHFRVVEDGDKRNSRAAPGIYAEGTFLGS